MTYVYVTIQKEDIDITVSLLRAANIVFPNTIANVLTDHNVAAHNALGIDADTVDGWHSQDLIPAGSIIPWIGGYFANGANGGYARVLGSANTIAGANGYLNAKGWYVCNGAVLNDADSPIFNGAGRYLPNLSDDRFIMGDNVAGGSGDFGAHTHIAGSHSHGSGTLVNAAADTHGHNSGTLAGSQATHSHPITGAMENANLAHTHGAGTLAGSSHAHGITGRSHRHTYLPGEGGVVNTSYKDGCNSPTEGQTVGITGITGAWSILNLHKHTLGTLGTGAAGDEAVSITGGVAGGGAHNHVITGSTANGGAVATAGASALPKYLSCFYIMRVR